MDRKFLESLSLPSEQIDKIIAEHGKAVQTEQNRANQLRDAAVAKAVEPLNAQITQLTAQNTQLQNSVKNAPNVDSAVKAEVERLTKEHEKALKEITKKHEEETTAVWRIAETKDFFRSLDKKFVTPETQSAFETRLNEALADKKNEGKNRADIFATLILGEDGKERADIFAAGSTVAEGNDGNNPPNVMSDTNPLPGASESKPLPLII